jgi:hypothetical protein
MLFDLRSRGRRTTVKVIYTGLAIVMGLGLVLFGVGTGTGGGGLLNAFNPSSGSSGAKAYVSAQTKAAEKLVQQQPNNPQAWASLVRDHYGDASANFNSTTNTFTPAALKDLRAAAQAWTRYLQLEKNPDQTLTRLMAQTYADLGEYNQSAQTWEILANANPKQAVYWAYVAEAAYQAKSTDLGNLAAAKAVSLTPKAQRAALRAQLNQFKAQAASAPTTTTTSTG